MDGQDWDDELGTVHPDITAELTLEAHEEYSDKRILAHWMQPHHPFLSETLSEYNTRPGNIWWYLRRGEVDLDDVRTAYEDTLESVFPHLEYMLVEIDGRRVVSADHGNAYAESPWWCPFPIHGHPRGVRTPATVEIPWLVLKDGPRRRIVEGDVRGAEASPDLRKRLVYPGYVDSVDPDVG